MTLTTPLATSASGHMSNGRGGREPALIYGAPPGIRRSGRPGLEASVRAFETAHRRLIHDRPTLLTADSSLAAANYNSVRLMRIWEDFVHNPGRRIGERVWSAAGWTVDTYKHFGVETVFDGCLGSGWETIHYAQHGLKVTGNDLDTDFIRMACANADSNRVDFRATNFDWRDLYRHFEAEAFDGISCTGNSLTYVFGRKQQLLALANFYHLLPKGGVLIVDERNYKYILDNRREILDNGNFRYTKKTLYCGPKVHGHPAEITDDYVLMQYDHVDYPGEPGYLKLYPFKGGELQALLLETGFGRVYMFSDYRPGYHEDADFHHYVCVK